ncbi:DUF4476 domain-containing protein [bacterium AH-315-M05]|nr:DUF4476 domain-containing protein [bacterium AH-315-M05]
MKKATLLFILLLAGVSAVFSQKSNAIFFTENGERFTVILNGVRQNPSPETNVMVTDLNAPNYKLKVIFENETLGTVDKNLYLEPGTERTFVIKLNKKGIYTLRMRSEVPIAQAPSPAPQQKVVVFTAIQPPAPVATTTTISTTTTTTEHGHDHPHHDGENVSMQINVDGTGVGINVNVSDADHAPTTTTSTTYTTTTTITTEDPVMEEPHHHIMPGYNGPIGCPWPMSESEFAGVKGSITSKTFDDSKLTIAKQVIGANCLLSSQVKEIMILFSFEDTRLEIAKYAYGYTFDLGNYYKVNDAFDFELTIEELNEYINSVGR